MISASNFLQVISGLHQCGTWLCGTFLVQGRFLRKKKAAAVVKGYIDKPL